MGNFMVADTAGEPTRISSESAIAELVGVSEHVARDIEDLLNHRWGPDEYGVELRGTVAVLRAALRPFAENGTVREWLNPPLGHYRRTSTSGRQICCQKCHGCGGDLRRVLDGERWCDECGAYR